MEQRALGSVGVMSLLSLAAQGRARHGKLPSPQLFCNSCWTGREEKCRALGMGRKEAVPVEGEVTGIDSQGLGPQGERKSWAGAP